jgi:hypothetical protein
MPVRWGWGLDAVAAAADSAFLSRGQGLYHRVGSGPFPSEQDNAIGQRIRDKGHEYGTTTGRPRRCGWFDAVAVRYSAAISGITDIAMMHLDTLAGHEQLNICHAYQIDGKTTDFFPADSNLLARAQCVYQTVPGWKEDLSGISRFEDLPQTAQNYVKTVEKNHPGSDQDDRRRPRRTRLSIGKHCEQRLQSKKEHAAGRLAGACGNSPSYRHHHGRQ